MSPNFAQLRAYDEQLSRLGVLAERYFPEDPNTALLKLRHLGELLDRQWETWPDPRYLSDHEDELLGIEHGYGAGLQRNQPGHGLARNHQPGDCRLDHGHHPPGGPG